MLCSTVLLSLAKKKKNIFHVNGCEGYTWIQSECMSHIQIGKNTEVSSMHRA